MKNNVYTGHHNDEEWYHVKKNGELFDHKLSLKIRNHSPDGFAWGYYGSGPSQLALAILLEEAGENLAEEFYQEFKVRIIAGLPCKNTEKTNWTLTSEDVRNSLKKIIEDFAEKEENKDYLDWLTIAVAYMGWKFKNGFLFDLE